MAAWLRSIMERFLLALSITRACHLTRVASGYDPQGDARTAILGGMGHAFMTRCGTLMSGRLGDTNLPADALARALDTPNVARLD